MTVQQFYRGMSVLGLFMTVVGLYLWLGIALGTFSSGIILMAIGLACVATGDEETKP